MFKELLSDHEGRITENFREIQNINDRIVLYAF